MAHEAGYLKVDSRIRPFPVYHYSVIYVCILGNRCTNNKTGFSLFAISTVRRFPRMTDRCLKLCGHICARGRLDGSSGLEE